MDSLSGIDFPSPEKASQLPVQGAGTNGEPAAKRPRSERYQGSRGLKSSRDPFASGNTYAGILQSAGSGEESEADYDEDDSDDSEAESEDEGGAGSERLKPSRRGVKELAKASEKLSAQLWEEEEGVYGAGLMSRAGVKASVESLSSSSNLGRPSGKKRHAKVIEDMARDRDAHR